MAMTEEILALCRAMGAGEDREELLLPLVQAAETALAGRLKRGVTAADCGGAFPLAAAMIAMDGWNAATGADRVTAFTAGEVSIATAGTGSAAGSSLTDQAGRLMAPWLGETGFAFKGVPG